jgi:hypothetical protein
MRTIVCLAFCLLLLGCAGTPAPVEGDSGIMGFGFLRRIPGLWHGPVTTTTPAGSFPDWYVDFRPISPSQVGQYSTLDQDTVNFISFFVVRHGGKMKIAMRTEGIFQNKGCVTYEVLDEADEEKGYYRFSDFQTGSNRAYTEFFFKGDRMTVDTYTNRFNTVSPLELHSRWKAVLGDRESVMDAVHHFGYPQPEVVKDFSNAFKDMSESIYFTFERDPYPAEQLPYLGELQVNLTIDESLRVEPDHELFVLLCTKSLFEGYRYEPENWKYFSRYVFLPPDVRTYTFENVHPGEYFIYSYNDTNGDKRHLSGDYMSSVWSHSVVVVPEQTTTVETRIDLLIP